MHWYFTVRASFQFTEYQLCQMHICCTVTAESVPLAVTSMTPEREQSLPERTEVAPHSKAATVAAPAPAVSSALTPAGVLRASPASFREEAALTAGRQRTSGCGRQWTAPESRHKGHPQVVHLFSGRPPTTARKKTVVGHTLHLGGRPVGSRSTERMACRQPRY